MHGVAQAPWHAAPRPARSASPISPGMRIAETLAGTVDTETNREGDHMRTMLAAILLALMGLAGCNTVEGVGKDIERGGERLQDSADKRR